jgi:hypothetical protein
MTFASNGGLEYLAVTGDSLDRVKYIPMPRTGPAAVSSLAPH